MKLTCAAIASAFLGTACAVVALPAGIGAGHGGRRVAAVRSRSLAAKGLQHGHRRAHHYRHAEDPTPDQDLPRMVLSNLGAQGPDGGDFHAILLENVGLLSTGASITVAWTNNTPYTPGDVASNVMFNGIFPSINVACDTNVSVRASFTDNSTGLPIRLSKFHLTVLMLDMETGGTGIQQVIMHDIPAYYVADNTSLEVRTFGNNDMMFTGTTVSKSEMAPGTPFNMTEDEEAGSVSVAWDDVEEVSFYLIAHGCSTASSGRTFKFAGLSSLVPNFQALRGVNGLQHLKSSTRRTSQLQNVCATVLALLGLLSFTLLH